MNSILIVLPILTILMFDLGLTLHLSDFVRLFKSPRAMFVGLAGQLIVLPLIALAIGSLLKLPELQFIGLMLIACSPGGSSSNIFSKLAKGDVALSVSLTAFSSVITLFTLPFLMSVVTQKFGQSVGVVLPVGNLLKQNLFTMVLPIALGIVINRFLPKAAASIDKVLSKAAFPLLMLLIVIFYIQNKTVIVENFASLGLAAGMLIIVSILVAALMSMLSGLDRIQKRTIVIEVGMQNAAQAIAVAVSPFVFANPAIAVPAILYSLLMNLVLLTYVGVIKLFSAC